ncbi:MAG: PAS domain S-box protein [Phycisphaerae bacterium]
MSATRHRLSSCLRGVQWTAAVVALLIGGVVVSGNHRQRDAVLDQLRERNRLKMRAARERIEGYFGEVQLCLRLMTLYPHVLDPSDESTRYLESIYHANYDRLHLSEIYIHKRGFSGTTRPFRALERADEAQHGDDDHTTEREGEEYAVQARQLRRFEENPALDTLISEPVNLCTGEPGRVFSVPIRRGGALLGMVSGMVPSRIISDELENSSPKVNWVLLAHERTSVDVCTDFPPEMKPWFQERLERDTVRGFFENREDAFRAGNYAALWTPTGLPGEQEWYVAFLYDEAASLQAAGIAGKLTGWGSAGVVLLLGGAVVIMCSVIRALVAARRDSEERARALQDREARLRSILDAAAEGILICDERGRIESFNAAAERLTGWTADKILGRTISVLAPSPEAEKLEGYIRRYVDSGARKTLGVGREVVGLRRDGSTFPMYVAVSEVRLGDRRLFTGILSDLTERKRTEETIRRHSEILEQTVRERTAELASAKEKAEASNRAKSTFLANMSHELRTPLHGILSFAGFGINEHATIGRSELRDYFQSIRESGRSLLVLLNDLLDLAKLEAGKMTFNLQRTDLAALIRSVSGEFSALASERQLRIRCLDPSVRAVAQVDPERMKQVVRNLLGNAVKFSPPGGLVAVNMRRRNGAVIVSFCDEGPGIPRDELESVFDKFVQSSNTRTGAGGTGLGLAICRQMVTGQGGRMWAENNPGPGATLSFSLPVAPGPRKAAKDQGLVDVRCLGETS